MRVQIDSTLTLARIHMHMHDWVHYTPLLPIQNVSSKKMVKGMRFRAVREVSKVNSCFRFVYAFEPACLSKYVWP